MSGRDLNSLLDLALETLLENPDRLAESILNGDIPKELLERMTEMAGQGVNSFDKTFHIEYHNMTFKCSDILTISNNNYLKNPYGVRNISIRFRSNSESYLIELSKKDAEIFDKVYDEYLQSLGNNLVRLNR